MLHPHHAHMAAAGATVALRHPALWRLSAGASSAAAAARRVVVKVSEGQLPKKLERILTRAVRAKEKREAAEVQYRAELVAAIEEGHEEGLSDAEIAQALGVSRQRVYQLRLGRYR
jgi:hypothetical protein